MRRLENKFIGARFKESFIKNDIFYIAVKIKSAQIQRDFIAVETDRKLFGIFHGKDAVFFRDDITFKRKFQGEIKSFFNLFSAAVPGLLHETAAGHFADHGAQLVIGENDVFLFI